MNATTTRNWPVKPCSRCGEQIQLVNTRNGWRAFDCEEFRPHTCERSEDVYDHPRMLLPLFNPRRNRFD